MDHTTIQFDNLQRRPPFKRQLRALCLKNASLQVRVPNPKILIVQLQYKKANLLFLFFPAVALLTVAGLTGTGEMSVNNNDSFYTNFYQPYTSTQWMWSYFINSTPNSIGNLTAEGYEDGFLGFIKQRSFSTYWYSNYFPPEYQYVPYFVEAPSSNWVDDTMWDATTSWADLKTQYDDDPPYQDTKNVATAAIEFQKLNLSQMQIEYIVQTDTADWIEYNWIYYYFTGLEARYYFTYYLHSALIIGYINSTMNTTVNLNFVFVTFKSFPNNNAGMLMLVLYVAPLMFSMNLPMVVYFLVSERATRFLEMMKIMGLKMKAYWVINLLYFGTFTFLSFVVMYVMSFPFYGSQNWVVATSAPVVLLLAFLWAFSGTSFALLWSQFFVKPMPAAGALLLITMFDSLLCSFVLMLVYDSATLIPWWCMLYPPHTFVYGFFLLSRFMYDGPPQYLALDHWTTIFTTQMFYVYITMIVQTAICLFLTNYFHNVWPREHGIVRPWNYLFKASKKNMHYNLVIDSNADIEETEGADCRKERLRATNLKRPLPVRLVFLKKEYEHRYKREEDTNFTHVALASFCLALDTGECVGLLGPNGAGKSTVMNILTGLVQPTSGFAVIHGHNIITDMEEIHQLVGFCPQFNVLWEEITVEDHLLFYIRLKGAVPIAFETQELNNIISMLGFSEFCKRPVSTLSGGEKRRLSIAIAFIGNPKLILLDEPTTGLDLTSRYQIWDLINERKVGRSILLTTHNMQEADALCSRIALMSRGKLLCIDQPAHLKSRFGKGFKLAVTPTRGNEDTINEYLLQKFPSIHSLPGQARALVFLVPSTNEQGVEKDEVKISKVLTEVIALEKENRIEEWKMQQCSLEEVFLNLIHEDEILE